MRQFHLTVGHEPWCGWSGCQAGRDVMAKAGHVTCGQPTAAAAKRAAKALRPHFKRGTVCVVTGPCPNA